MKKEAIKNWEILFKAVHEKRDGGFIYDKINELDKREREILSMRFGLEAGLTHTLEEVGQAFGVTKHRVLQIQTVALEKLRL